MGEKTNEHRPGEGCYYLLCGISERDGYGILTLAHMTEADARNTTIARARSVRRYMQSSYPKSRRMRIMP